MKTNADFYEVFIGSNKTIEYAKTEQEGRMAFERTIKQLTELPFSDWRETTRARWEDCQEIVLMRDIMNNKTVLISFVARHFGPYLKVEHAI